MLAFIGWSTANAQVGIGTTTPEPSSVLDVSSSEKGFLPPRLITAQRNAIASPPAGLVVYNTTTNQLEFSNGTSWVKLEGGSEITAVNASANTGSGVAAIGTTTPNPAAVLDITATDKGFLPPRLSTTERNAIASPAEGLTIYNTTVGCLQFFNGSGWVNICDGSIVGPPIATGLCAGEPSLFYFNGLEYRPVESAGRCWLDRNLGATRVATSLSDTESYGFLYQWGRATDGHQNRTSGVFIAALSSDLPPSGTASGSWDGLFIQRATSLAWVQNPTTTLPVLWQGVNGTNNPCPSGYRPPTNGEFETQRASWNNTRSITDAFDSPLKFPAAGSRSRSTSNIGGGGTGGLYWTSTWRSDNSLNRPAVLFISNQALYPNNQASTMGIADSNFGASVRCIKN